MSYRGLLVLALIAGSPAVAAAQFTTFIPQQSRAADSVAKVVAVQQKVQADSIADTRLTNIKTWVDSASGTLQPPTTTADSLSATAGVANAANASGTSAATDTMMANGRRAPATASVLPLSLLVGVGGLGFGVYLLAGSRRPREAHVSLRTRDRT